MDIGGEKEKNWKEAWAQTHGTSMDRKLRSYEAPKAPNQSMALTRIFGDLAARFIGLCSLPARQRLHD